MFRSRDGGDTWAAINTGLTHPFIFTLAIDPLVPSMGGETEIVLVLKKPPGPPSPSQYLLLATTLTGTLQKELREAAEQGYEVLGIVSRKEHK